MSNNIWQLKTTPIKGIEEDKLSHSILANLLKSKTEELFSTDDIPSCFCLNGEYGSGKSSIINLYLEKYSGDSKRKIVHFNAWRHKNENIYYALMRNIYYTLNNKDGKDFRDPNFIFSLTNSKEIIDLDNKFTNLVYANISIKKTDQDSITQKLENFVQKKVYKISSLFSLYLLKQIGFFAFIISLIAVLFSYLSGNELSSSLLIGGATFLSLFLSAPFILFFLEKNADILPKIVELNILPDETTVNLPNIYNTEHLQCLFRQLLNGRKDEKIIIIVEDVDRKDNDEIIKALNDLRTFIDLGEAVFIIPCDIQNIEKAFKDIIVENQIGENGSNPDIDWRSKDYCTKIFSHIVSIPPQNKQDLRLFLLSKIKETGKHSINKYLDSEKINDLIDILIAPSVRTPRETINTFNRFTLQLEYAIQLENEGKRLKKGTITNHILEYARIHMLANHYKLEHQLLLNPELPSWIQLLNRNNKEDIPSTSFPIAERTYNSLSDEVKEFISRTEDYYSDLARPFIYLDETAYSGNIGNEAYNIILTSLKNRTLSKIIEQLQNEDEKNDVNEAIIKIISNISYSTDIKNIIYSLIECYIHLDTAKMSAARFIVEHFQSIGRKQLYTFKSSTILEIIADSPKAKHYFAKNLYFKIIGEEETADIITINKLFELEIALLLKLNTEHNFVGKEIKDGLQKNLSIPLTDKKEEKKQIIELSSAIDQLAEISIKNFINTNIVKRISSVLDANDTDLDAIESILLKLSKILLSSETLVALEPLLKGSNKEENLYLKICNFLSKDIMALNLDSSVTSNIQKNIIAKYLKEDVWETDYTHLIDNALALFGKLDGNYFRTTGKASPSYSNIMTIIKENISSSSNKHFIDYNLKAIDIIEDSAEYKISQNITDIFIEKINENINNPSEDNYAFCEIIAHHLANKNRIVSLDGEASNKYKDLLIGVLKTEVTSSKANTNKTDYIVSFLEILCKVDTFNYILIEWLTEEEVKMPENSTQLSSYSSYIRLLDFLLQDLNEFILNNLFSKLFSVVSNTTSSHSEPAWAMLYKLSTKYPTHPLWEKIKERLIAFFPYRASYFTISSKTHILLIINNIDQSIGDSLITQYETMLLELLESDIENSIDFIYSGWKRVSIDSQIKIIKLIQQNSKWEDIKQLIETNNSDFEECAIIFYDNDNLDIFEIICGYLKTDSARKTIAILLEQKQEEIDYKEASQLAKYISHYNMKIHHVNKDIIEVILIKLLQSDFSSKLLALNIAIMLKCDIEKTSNIYREIKNSFIDKIDSSTNFEIIQSLNDCLINLNIKSGIGFQSKLKANLDDIENEELKNKYKSLLKYGK